LTCRHTLWSSSHGHSDHMGNKRTESDKLREVIGPCLLNDRSHFVVVRAFALQSEGRWFDTAAATQKNGVKMALAVSSILAQHEEDTPRTGLSGVRLKQNVWGTPFIPLWQETALLAALEIRELKRLMYQATNITLYY